MIHVGPSGCGCMFSPDGASNEGREIEMRVHG